MQTRTSDNMADISARFSPYFAQVHDNTQAKITTLNELLKSQVEGMKTSIQNTAESMMEGFESTTEELRSTVEDKVKELRGWFQPYIAMFTM